VNGGRDPSTLRPTVNDVWAKGGTFRYKLVGNDGSSADAVETLLLYFNGSGSPAVSVPAPPPPHLAGPDVSKGSVTTKVGEMVVVVKRFRFFNKVNNAQPPNIVGSCDVGVDGYTDSVGDFVVEVHRR
jgi:hypothetical protein